MKKYLNHKPKILKKKKILHRVALLSGTTVSHLYLLYSVKLRENRVLVKISLIPRLKLGWNTVGKSAVSRAA